MKCRECDANVEQGVEGCPFDHRARIEVSSTARGEPAVLPSAWVAEPAVADDQGDASSAIPGPPAGAVSARVDSAARGAWSSPISVGGSYRPGGGRRPVRRRDTTLDGGCELPARHAVTAAVDAGGRAAEAPRQATQDQATRGDVCPEHASRNGPGTLSAERAHSVRCRPEHIHSTAPPRTLLRSRRRMPRVESIDRGQSTDRARIMSDSHWAGRGARAARGSYPRRRLRRRPGRAPQRRCGSR